MKSKRIAFWTYDLYPHTLHGEITGKKDKDGYYEVQGFRGYKFKPFMVLPESKAAPIIDKLNKLKLQYINTIRDIENIYKQRLLDVIKDHPSTALRSIK